jgi:hypothetical protein
MKPFMLTSSSQFRPEKPPSLLSRSYARDLNEVKAYGGDGITTPSARTPEQTAIAQFWNANAINADNQTLRDAASAQSMDLVDTARLLAMGVLVEADTGIACFDAKYAYTFWRPVTAIRNADIAGNGKTEANPTWIPLLTTPNHPEYPAAHGCLTAALGEVLAKGLGTRNINVDMPGATGGFTTLTTSRHYDTVKQLDSEIVNARVWAGLHYRNSGKVGVELGKDVARWTLLRYFRPVHIESDDDHESEGGEG